MGKRVLPGLIDNHIHPIIGAVNGSKCSLARIKATVEAIRPVIQACIQKQPGGPNDWIDVVQLDNYGFSATAADLERTLKSPLIPNGECSVAQAFMQLCLHSHGHRAQAAKLLRRHGGTPPASDFILWLTKRPGAEWPDPLEAEPIS